MSKAISHLAFPHRANQRVGAVSVPAPGIVCVPYTSDSYAWRSSRLPSFFAMLLTGTRVPFGTKGRSARACRSAQRAVRHARAAALMARFAVLGGVLLGSVLWASPALAQASATSHQPPPGFDSWLACTFYVVGLVTAVVVLFQKLFPRRVPSIESEFVSKAELAHHCAVHHKQVDEANAMLRAEVRDLRHSFETAEREHEDRTRRLHERIEKMVPVVYRIAGALNVQAGD